MPVGFERILSVGSKSIFQISKHPVNLQGGFALDNSGLTANTFLNQGQPMLVDEVARTAKPLHTAKVYENATNSATTVKVAKGHLMIVGDYLAAAKGGAAYAITAIDASNSAYDVLTVGTTLGVALTAGQTVFASTATGASAAALPATLKGILYSDIKVQNGQELSVTVEAHVYARRIPYTADIAAAIPGIMYSQSK